jgi:hypothetical protein
MLYINVVFSFICGLPYNCQYLIYIALNGRMIHAWERISEENVVALYQHLPGESAKT